MGVTKVSLEELPAELAERIRDLQDAIEITDHDQTVARIVPPETRLQYVHRAPEGRVLGDYVIPRLSFDVGEDLLEELYEDRRKDRNK